MKITKIENRHMGHTYIEFDNRSNVMIPRGEVPASLKVGDEYTPNFPAVVTDKHVHGIVEPHTHDRLTNPAKA